MIRSGKFFGRGLTVPLALLLTMLAAGWALAAGPAPATKSMSVGDFVVLVASRLASADASRSHLTVESAAATLQGAGIKISHDLNAPMTEADAVEIFRQFDITLAPADPGSLLDPNRAASLVGIFSSTLAARGGSQTAKTDSRGGSLESQGRSASQAVLESIADCQALPKTQDCNNCCRELLGGNSNDTHTNRTCAKACNTKSRNASPSEPTP
jgi:hypothetical protein